MDPRHRRLFRCQMAPMVGAEDLRVTGQTTMEAWREMTPFLTLTIRPPCTTVTVAEAWTWLHSLGGILLTNILGMRAGV